MIQFFRKIRNAYHRWQVRRDYERLDKTGKALVRFYGQHPDDIIKREGWEDAT